MKIKTKHIILWCSLTLLISLLVNSFAIYAHYQAVSSSGSRDMIWSTLYLGGMIWFVLFVFIPISLIGLIFKKTKPVCVVLLLCSIVYYGISVVCFRISDNVRIEAFHKLAQRSGPLVQAINNYESQHGHPPSSLGNLVPDFITNIPQTGMGAYPEYEYKVGKEAQEFSQNAWCLVVQTPMGGLNWDIFVYLPKQNYSELGSNYGGVAEQVEDWAYVYE